MVSLHDVGVPSRASDASVALIFISTTAAVQNGSFCVSHVLQHFLPVGRTSPLTSGT